MGHLFFEFFDLMLCELTFGMVEDFLWKHFEYAEIILADIHVFHRAGADVVDEWSPGAVPFVLNDLDEDAIAFWEDVLHGSLKVLDCCVLKDHVYYVAFEEIALFEWKGQPFLLSQMSVTLMASSSRTSM